MKIILALILTASTLVAVSANAAPASPKPTVGGCTYSTVCNGDKCLSCSTCCEESTGHCWTHCS